MKSRFSRKYLLITLVVVFGIVFYVRAILTRAQGSSVTITISPVSGTSLTIGSVFVATAKNVNNTSSALTVTDKFYLTFPDGVTRVQILPKQTSTSIAAGGSFTFSAYVTSSAFTNQTGTFTWEADAFDSSGNSLGSTTFQFAILPLPASLVPPQFTDLATSAGVAAIHHSDMTDCMDMNGMGTGAGWADVDGDGFLDLFVSDFNGASHLYHNNGNLTFTDVTSTAFPNSLTNGSLTLTHATGVTWADYNNDGHPDLLIMATGHPYLFRNNGDGTFTDVTTTAGLSTLTGRGESAAWADYDSDGWLDLYTVYYNQNCNAKPVSATALASDHLFHNNGDGTFTDVTNLMGGTTNSALTGLGFAATWFDFNNDNRPDLYVVNDQGGSVHPNVLWRNDGSDGKGGWIFTDVSSSALVNYKESAMGVGVGDYNRDGFFDISVSDMGPNYLAKNLKNGTFANSARNLGVARNVVPSGTTTSTNSVTWGTGFVDLNNDGYEDVFMAGGQMMMMMAMGSMPNTVLVNNLNSQLTGLTNDGSFLDLTFASGAGGVSGSRTVALADFDADGWMDALVANYPDQAPQLFRNEGPAAGNTNSWLEVRLVGGGSAPLGSLPHGSNRDGVGAKLTLTAGSDTQYRQIISGTSLGAGSQLAAHFGMRSHTQADSLTILWPSGLTQTFQNLPVNQRLVVTEGSSVLGNDPTPPRIPL